VRLQGWKGVVRAAETLRGEEGGRILRGEEAGDPRLRSRTGARQNQVVDAYTKLLRSSRDMQLQQKNC
jgi:hypothetical protein